MMPIMLIYWTKWLTFLNSLCGNSIISKKHVSHNLDANKFVVQLDLKFQIMLIVVENNVDFLWFRWNMQKKLCNFCVNFATSDSCTIILMLMTLLNQAEKSWANLVCYVIEWVRMRGFPEWQIFQSSSDFFAKKSRLKCYVVTTI